MNTKLIGTLEKVFVIGIFLLAVIGIVCFSVGIVMSDTVANPAELASNVCRFLGIITIVLIFGDMYSAYIELNKKRFD